MLDRPIVRSDIIGRNTSSLYSLRTQIYVGVTLTKGVLISPGCNWGRAVRKKPGGATWMFARRKPCIAIDGWVNNREAGDLSCHYDVNVMIFQWNLNQNTTISTDESWFEDIVCKLREAFISRPQCAKSYVPQYFPQNCMTHMSLAIWCR